MRDFQLDAMTTDNVRLRSEFLNTQVITRDTGKRLGVVKELLVDIDQREVVALGMRDNALSVAGMPKYMYLNSLSQSGDVILVENEDVLEDVDVEAFSKLINSEVITETGELLGKVRDFQFGLPDGKVSSLIIASIGLPQIPDQVISTYELPVEEIVSSGPNRLIVFEGAEERLVQLSVGFLERLGIGRPPWEREEEDLYYTPTARPENQLGTGVPVPPPRTARPIEAPPEPVYEEAWDDDYREEVQARPIPRRQAESIRYEEEAYIEEDNWSDIPERPVVSYQEEAYLEPEPPANASAGSSPDYEYDMQEDIWDDDVAGEPYEPPRVNLPQKQKAPEYYEEESEY
jgi:sporulation protein YlmC with PRC-barrel domain